MSGSIVVKGRREMGRSMGRGSAVLAAALVAAAALAGPQAALGADEGATWDYRTIFVVWDEEAADWRADWSEGPSTVGLEAVLDAEGALGWDLVEVAHEVYDTVVVDETTSQQARRLRLILKREATEGAEATTAAAVAISGFAFGPASLEVAAGTTVRWDNEDPSAHTVTSDDGSFDSGVVPSGEAFEHTFDTAGTFTYACQIHTSMTGTVIVS